MLRSRSWWLTVLFLAVLAFGYSAVYAQNETPTPAPGASPVASAQADGTTPGGTPAAGTSTAAGGDCGILKLCGGNPTAGQQLYVNNCQSCHGADLSGGIGFRLIPLQTCPDQTPAGIQRCPDETSAYIVDKLRHGFPGTAMLPAAFPNITTDKQRADLAAFILQQDANWVQQGGVVKLTPLERMIDNVWLIATLVVVVLGITYGLSWYNMRWIAKKNG